MKIWILPKTSGSRRTSFIESSFGAKSKIRGIRLKNNIFEIYVKESVVGQLSIVSPEVEIFTFVNLFHVSVLDPVTVFGAKSRIHGIRLKNNIFEIYVTESVVG